MSESEDFLTRWSRLKHAATVESSGAGKPAEVEARHGGQESPAPAFDPASLPSIESIDAATDIRPFLEACVPDELRCAALRSTWSADPAIRDFVGIAESQWDFNDPATIPGFAVHAGTDHVFNLAAQSVDALTTAIGTSPESAPMVEGTVAAGDRSDVADLAQQVTATTTDHSRAAGLNAATEQTSGDPGSRLTHSHGGALPR